MELSLDNKQGRRLLRHLYRPMPWGNVGFGIASNMQVVFRTRIAVVIGRWPACFGLAILLPVALPLHAEDCAAPCLGYAVTTELEADQFFNTHPSEDEGSDLEPAIDAEFTVSPIDRLKLVSVITTEPVLDRSPGDDRVFSSIGTYANRLYGELDFDRLTLKAGKFEPEFGLATHKLDGIYATGLVGAYDNEERWGAESSFTFAALGLSDRLTISAFTTDRTFLSESLFTNRGRTRLSDDGAGNIEGIASLAAVLEGCKGAASSRCYDDGRFGFRLGIRHQKAGHPKEDRIEDAIAPQDETGVLVASTARFDFGDAILRALGELAYFKHFDGEPGDAWIGTVSASLERGPVTAMAAYSCRRNLIAGEPDTIEDLVDLTAAYDLGDNYSIAGEQWTLAAAYGYARNAGGGTAHAVGITVTIDFNGTIGASRKGSDGDAEE
jgi:hypothetical protein